MRHLELKEKLENNIFYSPCGCWIWTGAITERGYGVIRNGNKFIRSHRASYMIYKGDPNNLFVCHTCDVPSCVNPDHLFLGTCQDNINDRDRKGRHRIIKGQKRKQSVLNDTIVMRVVNLKSKGFNYYFKLR